MKKNAEKKYTIGVLIGNAHTWHPKEVIEGVRGAAEGEDINVIYFLGTQSSFFLRDLLGDSDLNNYDYQFNTIYDYAMIANVDALVLAYGSLSYFLEHNDKKKFLDKFKEIPYVILEDEDVPGGNGCSMIIDNYNGMSSIMRHLTDVHGYRNIVYVSGPKSNKDAEERLRTYLDVMQDHGYPVGEKSIAYGDYSDTHTIDILVEKLLDENENVEAIVFANDEMTNAGYRVCEKRDMVVGCDIAITGFDDYEMAKTMNPPLTTVSQNGYDMGYRAIKNALRMCRGEHPDNLVIGATMQVRKSCGCDNSGASQIEDWDDIYKKSVVVLDKILMSQGNDVIWEKYLKSLTKLLLYLQEKTESSKDISSIAAIKLFLNILLDELIGNGQISILELSKELFSYLSYRQSICKNKDIVKRIVAMNGYIQEYLQATLENKKSKELQTFQHKAWMVPFVSRDFMIRDSDEKRLFRDLMKQLRRMGAESSYLYLLPTPIVHHYGQDWQCPNKMYLRAYHIGEQVVSYENEECPKVTKRYGITQFFDSDEGHRYIAFDLFSGERQYGMLLCEIKTSEMDFFYVISLQLGNSLNYLEISNHERALFQELDEALKDLKGKNEILNTVSEYDSLTGLLNRRGFLDRVHKLADKNRGKTGYLILADLDHLKEINDCFGHMEGDFAIVSAGQILRQCTYRKDLVCRYGGDEFMAVVFSEEAEYDIKLRNKIDAECEKRNNANDKLFRVEMSFGIEKFVCTDDVDYRELMQAADDLLYEDKKNRSASIKKEIL